MLKQTEFRWFTISVFPATTGLSIIAVPGVPAAALVGSLVLPQILAAFSSPRPLVQAPASSLPAFSLPLFSAYLLSPAIFIAFDIAACPLPLTVFAALTSARRLSLPTRPASTGLCSFRTESRCSSQRYFSAEKLTLCFRSGSSSGTFATLA